MQPKISITGRIARFSFQHKWPVAAAWLIVFMVAGVIGSGLGKVLTTEFKDLSGSESARAKQVVDERLGTRPLDETVIVRSESETIDDPSFQRAYDALAARLGGVEGVAGVTTYQQAAGAGMVSADRHAALISVTLAGTAKEADRHIAGVLDVVDAANTDGFAVHTIGMASSDHELNAISEHDLQGAERFGLPVALAVMVLAFGTVVAAGVPLILGVAAIIPALGTVALIGRTFELSFYVTNVITMIGLAVGIDYSMFIIGRYREELARGRARLDAIAIASDTSGRAVLFSSITVLLALSGMLFVRSNIFVSIGVGAMVVVVYAIVASLTLLPAVLGIVGGAVNRVRMPYLGRAGYGTRFWAMVTRKVQRRPAVFAAASAGLLIAAALPLVTINLGSNGTETLPKETRTYQAIQALQQDFAAGRIDPIQVVVEGPIAEGRMQEAIGHFQKAAAARGLQAIDVIPGPDGSMVLIQLASSTTGTGEDARRVIADLRERVVPEAFAGSGASVSVGGNLASYVDAQHEMDSRLVVVFGFVLGLSFLLLLLVFRSVAIPAKAVLMNLLSVGAAYGLLVLVFQHGVGADLFGFTRTPQVEFWIPLFLFSILFGLSMDYHVFLLSRVQEEYHRSGDNTAAVAHGVTSTAGMITSAAAIMVAVFGAFASGRLAGIQQMGFGLAVAVLLDATVIRSVLVPASMQLLGRYNWWLPRRLASLPRMNIEGASQEPARVPDPVAVGADLGFAAGD